MKYKKLYDKLMLDDELLDMFPELKGNWEQDKKEFILLQQQMEDLSLNIIIEDEDYDG